MRIITVKSKDNINNAKRNILAELIWLKDESRGVYDTIYSLVAQLSEAEVDKNLKETLSSCGVRGSKVKEQLEKLKSNGSFVNSQPDWSIETLELAVATHLHDKGLCYSDLTPEAFNLSLYEAIEAVLNNTGWAQGENFAAGVFIKKNHSGYLTLASHTQGKTSPLEVSFIPYERAQHQKYRIIHTLAEAFNK